MSDDRIFVVHRVYNKDDRRYDYSKSSIYGWTDNKNIIKAFLSQRNRNKYYVDKMYGSAKEILEGFYNDLDPDNMINYIKLKSVNNKDKDFYLFMTANEMQEAEINIQKYFRDLCSISNIEGKGDYLGMIENIDPYYADALDFIGYRPPEISAMYPSSDYADDPGEIIGITELIETAYCGSGISPYEEAENKGNLPGLSMLTDVANKILYSVESFIKVLRDEL